MKHSRRARSRSTGTVDKRRPAHNGSRSISSSLSSLSQISKPSSVGQVHHQSSRSWGSFHRTQLANSIKHTTSYVAIPRALTTPDADRRTLEDHISLLSPLANPSSMQSLPRKAYSSVYSPEFDDAVFSVHREEAIAKLPQPDQIKLREGVRLMAAYNDFNDKISPKNRGSLQKPSNYKPPIGGGGGDGSGSGPSSNSPKDDKDKKNDKDKKKKTSDSASKEMEGKLSSLLSKNKKSSDSIFKNISNFDYKQITQLPQSALKTTKNSGPRDDAKKKKGSSRRQENDSQNDENNDDDELSDNETDSNKKSKKKKDKSDTKDGKDAVADDDEDEDESNLTDEEKAARKRQKYFRYASMGAFGVVIASFFYNQFKAIWGSYQRSRNSYTELYRDYLTNGLVERFKVDHNTIIAYMQPNQTIMKNGFEHPVPRRYAFDVINFEYFERRLHRDLSQLNLRDIPVQMVTDFGPQFYTSLLFFTVTMIIIVNLQNSLKGKSSPFKLDIGPESLLGGKKKFVMVKDIETRFDDVAGMDEAKAEIVEFVDFLKHPAKYHRLGAKLPKGALLSGPPGTGKTLLAKATAGEAGVPFFSVSGSDFLEMYVGMGSTRVRDLFSEARKHAPAIIFIDEIDAIARSRDKGNRSNEERESTLNQMLVEMDGFKSNEEIIVLAATNRPDMLDKALVRPGRMDRKIQIDAPDLDGRQAIFKVHLRKLKLNYDLDELGAKLAALTPGMVGADIANVCNEAAIGAARAKKDSVELVDFELAIDRVLGGLEKKNRSMSREEERKIVAYHESGHAVAGWFLEHADPLLKVTIVPRTSGALGFAQYLPKETALYQTEHLCDDIAMTLGGRAAEDVIFGKISTGASDDLKKTTKLAHKMIVRYGMYDKLPNLAFGADQSEQFQKNMSDTTSQIVDEGIQQLIDAQYRRVRQLLIDKKTELENLSQALLAKETINHETLVEILGPRPFHNDAYINYINMKKKDVAQLSKDAEVIDIADDGKADKTEDEKK